VPIITLPDGSTREFSQAISVLDVAADIGAGLAKATLAGRVNEELVDASFLIENDANLSIVTSRDEDGVDVIRHTTAHLLAQAVKQLFPSAQVTIGPVIDNGFYYDFAFERSFTPDDLEKIEKRMSELAEQEIPVERIEISRDDAVEFFRGKKEEYKAQIIESIPQGDVLSLYKQGDFTDLCRGPHVPHTGALKAFKLTKIAGAYWRGNSDNEMLQRIYGTAWGDKKALKRYLHRIQEAEKRDHRKIAKSLDLFHLQEEAPGMIFWHDAGLIIYRTIEQYIRGKLQDNNYVEVRTPQLVDKSLWEKSGHWEKFREDMFTVDTDNHEYAVKPMNCPGHVQIYNQGLKSYRDLPLRMAEFGSCHRNEPSGTLHGLMRLRNFIQDDAHIFCTEEQIQSEVSSFIDLLYDVYADFGFTDIIIKLSTRPEKRVGTEAEWDKAEKSLEDALNAKGLEWELQPGEGAFYGPKIEFSLKDCLERVWQCGTIQVDFSMPGRLDAQYIDADGTRQSPVMLHRAILGSLERFIGILIEEYAGKFPVWLAPTQVVLMSITDKNNEYIEKIAKILQKQGIRVKIDLRNEKIGFKIREHTLKRIPFLVVAGEKEVENNELAVRSLSGKNMGSFTPDAFIALLAENVAKRSKVEP
jgi:threonyl-tRNA synthetase